MKIDFNNPAHVIDLDKKLTIKNIKHILNHLKWERHEYTRMQEFWKDMGCSTIKDRDFDLIESLQTIFNYCENNVSLCKITNVFNTFVKVTEDVDYYEAYGYGEDKIYSVGYELEMDIPNELREKIINLSKKILQERENNMRDWY